MKFGLVTGLLGVAAAVNLDKDDDALVQEDAQMQELCTDMAEIDDESLVEVDEEEEKYKKHVKNTYKKHYGKTKKAIDKENHHILSTQKKCLSFVKKHRGHEKVCNWCRSMKVPSTRWKWVPNEKVWYRFYDGKWHYWGPSKTGFTASGWTWYKGYWHHGGYVFKFFKGKWYRYQGKRWTFYKYKVPMKPGIPRKPPVCRPFYVLKKYGYPQSLSARRLPRCKTGSGKGARYYQWKGHAACRFLGGKLTYQIHRTCKAGRPHQWARVTRCVRGAVISGKGFNYKKGK